MYYIKDMIFNCVSISLQKKRTNLHFLLLFFYYLFITAAQIWFVFHIIIWKYTLFFTPSHFLIFYFSVNTKVGLNFEDFYLLNVIAMNVIT